MTDWSYRGIYECYTQFLQQCYNFFPLFYTIYQIEGLRSGSKNFPGSKYQTKMFCSDNGLSSKSDTGDSLLGCFDGTAKSSLSSLDDNRLSGLLVEKGVFQQDPRYCNDSTKSSHSKRRNYKWNSQRSTREAEVTRANE